MKILGEPVCSKSKAFSILLSLVDIKSLLVPIISLLSLALLPCILFLNTPSAISFERTISPFSFKTVSYNLALPVVGFDIAILEFINIVFPASFPTS